MSTAKKQHGDHSKGTRRGFVKIQRDLLCRNDLSLVGKLIYAIIVDMMRKKDEAWPSYAHLATEIGLSERTVMRAVTELEGKRLLQKDPRSGQSNVYRLMADDGEKQDSGAGADGPSEDDPTPDKLSEVGSDEPLTDCHPTPDKLSRGGCQIVTHKKTKGRRRKKKTRDAAPRTPQKGKSGTSQNDLFEAICKSFNLKPATKSDNKRVGRVARDLVVKGATVEEITVRRGRYRSEWPNVACTPEALLKHWDHFAAADSRPTAKPAEHSIIKHCRSRFGDDVDANLAFYRELALRVDAGVVPPADFKSALTAAKDGAKFRAHFTDNGTEVCDVG